MLRYYDETGILKPARIDSATGYRLYSVDQIPVVHKIIFLRDAGFNVAEIALALDHWDQDSITKQFQDKQQEIARLIEAQQEKLNKIAIAIRDMSEEKKTISHSVVLKSIPAYQVLSLRRIIPNHFHEGSLWQEMDEYIERENLSILPQSHCLAIYHDVEHKDADVDVEVCTVVDHKGISRDGFTYRDTEKVDTMACAMVYGPYEHIAGAYESLAYWLTKHRQYGMVGLCRQVCHRGPSNEEDPRKYLTEIQMPVEKLVFNQP